MENKTMNQDLLADIWNVMSEHIPEKEKNEAAQEYITTLLDYGVSENVLEGMLGIDTYLDGAIEYAINDEPFDDVDEEWS